MSGEQPCFDDTVPGAIKTLQEAGINVERKAYGFCVSWVDSSGKISCECGLEHDFTISISISQPGHPALWYVSDTMSEMVKYLVRAQTRLNAGEFKNIISALRAGGAFDIGEGKGAE